MYEFPKVCRVAKKSDIDLIFAHAKKISHGSLVLLYRPSPIENARLGMIISKRWFKRSVDRNRVKRLIRECFRHHLPHLKPWDMLFLLRAKVPFQQMNQECEAICQQLLAFSNS